MFDSFSGAGRAGKVIGKLRYYLKAVRWLWENRKWKNTRQKWKAFDKAMKEELGNE